MEVDFLDNIVKFNSLASGRDKLFRLVQYSSKCSWYYLEKYGLSEEIVLKLQRLSSALSTTRKFMRLGKSVDFIHGALRSIHLADNVLRWTITLSKVNQSVYLLFDHMVWAGRVGLAITDNVKWGKLSARFWLVTIILNIIRDLYEIIGVLYSEMKLRDAKISRSQYKNGAAEHKQLSRPSMSNSQLLLKCVAENPPAFLDLARNLCDAVLPLEALGFIKASPGIQGLTGTVSSILGIASTWNPVLRLVPS